MADPGDDDFTESLEMPNTLPGDTAEARDPNGHTQDNQEGQRGNRSVIQAAVRSRSAYAGHVTRNIQGLNMAIWDRYTYI